jgi:hypothetical protein
MVESRQTDSMLKQAVWADRLLNDPVAEVRPQQLFEQPR